MTRLFQVQLLISRVGQMCLTSFIQGQDIPPALCPECENFKPAEGATSAKDYHCLVEECSIQLTIKEVACSHIWVFHSHMGLFCPWLKLGGCHLQSDPLQNWEAFHKHLGSVHIVDSDKMASLGSVLLSESSNPDCILLVGRDNVH